MTTKKINIVLTHIVLIIAVILVGFPLLFALIKSTQSLVEVTTPSLKIGTSFFANFKEIWSSYNMKQYMANSFIYSSIVTIGKIVLSLLAANALVFFKFKGKKILFTFIVITLMFPTEILILGLFEVVSNKPAPDFISFSKWFFNLKALLFEPTKYGLGLGDAKLGVILPFFASATGVFLFRQHFLALPKSIADAARVDGVNSFQFLVYILLPMSLNTIGALALIQFIYVWNQYIWPRIIIQHNYNQVVQVGLNAIMSAGDKIEWNLVMTGSIITIIPPIIVFALLYKAFIKGYALSSNK